MADGSLTVGLILTVCVAYLKISVWAYAPFFNSPHRNFHDHYAHRQRLRQRRPASISTNNA
jgi:hypothetical protein